MCGLFDCGLCDVTDLIMESSVLRPIPLILVLRRMLVVAALSCVMLSLPVVAQNSFIAQNGNGQQNRASQQQGEATISQRRALEMVRARYPGTVVSINQVQRQGAVFYRVRMDDGGNIFTLYVNATSGDITREQ